MSRGNPIAVLFTQQLIGLNTRKTGMVFWAEALARRGFETYAVTTQLSSLSMIARSPRLKAVPREDLNAWRQRGSRLFGFVWLAPVHPARIGPTLLDQAAAWIYALYPRFMPSAICDIVRKADLVIIESCAAVLLFEKLRSLAPKHAKFVYCASDRLDTVGMHPMLTTALKRTINAYDLVRVPAQAMANDFPAPARVAFIPHGIDKAAFAEPSPSPFDSDGPHVIVAGDMLFDADAFRVLLDSFPEATFHAFGHMQLAAFAGRSNLQAHGEVPFATLTRYLLHADVGFAPYLDRPEAYYLSESSLKLIQYTYCRLPVVAPRFAVAGRRHIIAYAPGNELSMKQALEQALAYDRSTIDTKEVAGWDEVIERMLEAAGLGGWGESFAGQVPLSVTAQFARN